MQLAYRQIYSTLGYHLSSLMQRLDYIELEERNHCFESEKQAQAIERIVPCEFVRITIKW